MNIKQMKEWIKDKPDSSVIVIGVPGSGLENHRELKWTDIGLIHDFKKENENNCLYSQQMI